MVTGTTLFTWATFGANLEVENDVIGGVARRVDSGQSCSFYLEGLTIDDLSQ